MKFESEYTKRTPKKTPSKKKLDSDFEVDMIVSPPKRRSAVASNVPMESGVRRSARKSTSEYKLYHLSDSLSEFETSPAKKVTARRTNSSKTLPAKEDASRKAPSERSSTVPTSDTTASTIKRSSRKSTSKYKILPGIEIQASVSPPKRKSTVPIHDESSYPLSEKNEQSPVKRKSIHLSKPTNPGTPMQIRKSEHLRDESSDSSSEKNEQSPVKRKSTRLSKAPSYDFVEEKSNVSSPDVKKTPKRSVVKACESFMESPSLRRQVLTPKRSARKKLDWASPTSVKKVGSGFLSPVVKERTRRSLMSTSTSLIVETRANLHTSNIPKSLPCRENEFANVSKFILRKIEDKAGGCMYLSGVPGTGKTATVHAVIRSLQEKAKAGDIPKFDFVEINALRLTEPRQAYTRIWHELSGDKLSADAAMKALEKKFSRNNKRSTVIMVDELDYLCNRRQDVIYNILEWSTKSSAALAVITIANTMDLPERTLKGKVTSRMGLTRLVFQPYTFQQLQQIVMNRIGEHSTFHVDAIQLVARKVAAVSGDARRALDICRRVTEMVTSDTDIIRVTDIENAISQIFAGTRVQVIKKCSIMSQYLLRAMRDEFQRTGVEESTVGQIYKQLTSICAFEGCEAPPTGIVLNLCSVLADSGLILAEKSRNDLRRKISLNVSADDIFYACNA